MAIVKETNASDFVAGLTHIAQAVLVNPPPKELLGTIIEALIDQTYPDVQVKLPVLAYDVVVLVSGGLDSTVAYWLAERVCANKSIKAIHIDFGQIYFEREQKALDDLGIERDCITIPIGQSEYWSYYIPLRNLIATMVGANVGGEGTQIWLGYIEDDISPAGGDKSLSYVTGLRDYLRQSLSCDLVLLDIFTKVDWIRWAAQQGKIDALLRTFSCLESQNDHCGVCQSCLKRYLAFAAAEIPDAMILYNYQRHPLESSGNAANKYLMRILADSQAYSSRRQSYRNMASILFRR